jgi:hypothetical protein
MLLDWRVCSNAYDLEEKMGFAGVVQILVLSKFIMDFLTPLEFSSLTWEIVVRQHIISIVSM